MTKGKWLLIMDEGGSCTLTLFTTVIIDKQGITGEIGIPRAQAMLFLLKKPARIVNILAD